MNIPQRIVLIVGAFLIVLILITTSPVNYWHGHSIYWDNPLYKSINWETLPIYLLVIAGVTIMLFFALKSKKS
jgi:uncharacterized BrkB/YihY/UPF0761 family membrane protein